MGHEGRGGEPHHFHFSVAVQGHGANWTGEPYRVTVRAYSLAEACWIAAGLPLTDWELPEESGTPAVWRDGNRLIVAQPHGGCYDVIEIGATGADVTEELSELPTTAVPLVQHGA